MSHTIAHSGQNVLPHRAAEEKVQKSEQEGTSAQEPGDARKIDRFPEDVSTIVVHHSSILRNKRLLLAYRFTCPFSHASSYPFLAKSFALTPHCLIIHTGCMLMRSRWSPRSSM